MAANMTVGAHGREISAAEAQWSDQPDRPFSGGKKITFHDVLDALNPLQFVPVVGTVYRVITGDEGCPSLRTGVSLIAGALIGGPIGLLTSIGAALLEHFFPFEHMAHDALALSPAPATATATAAPAAAAIPPALGPSAAPPLAPTPVAVTGPGSAVGAVTAPAITNLATIQPTSTSAATPLVAAHAAAAYDRANAMAPRLLPG
jgi:hypothetical protein